MDEIVCTHCGAGGLEPGYLDDRGEGSQGFTRWVEGELERGLLGGARKRGRQGWEIEAYRCPLCSHLELFAFRPA